MHGHVLDALAGVAIEVGAPDAVALVELLAQLAARAGMRELVVRAHVHRALLGDPGANATARLLASEIDNPALDRLLTTTSPLEPHTLAHTLDR